mmetsp:Transcript_8308/g.21194  ORF Transcript_8308/g.21194 Transcript_8308/m.21194 type:complete len:86 (-) Transcript_8308:2017-2274(-)
MSCRSNNKLFGAFSAQRHYNSTVLHIFVHGPKINTDRITDFFELCLIPTQQHTLAILYLFVFEIRKIITVIIVFLQFRINPVILS